MIHWRGACLSPWKACSRRHILLSAYLLSKPSACFRDSSGLNSPHSRALTTSISGNETKHLSHSQVLHKLQCIINTFASDVEACTSFTEKHFVSGESSFVRGAQRAVSLLFFSSIEQLMEKNHVFVINTFVLERYLPCVQTRKQCGRPWVPSTITFLQFFSLLRSLGRFDICKAIPCEMYRVCLSLHVYVLINTRNIFNQNHVTILVVPSVIIVLLFC